MEDNLVGYLLNTLDADGQRRVEQLLASRPEARQRLLALRQAMRPLQLDRESDEPPTGLWVRTLARVAEHMCRTLPIAPAVAGEQSATPRPSWRRLDVLVAACLILTVGVLVPPALLKIRARSQRDGCADNMRKLGDSLLVYHDNHGSFPNPATENEPFNVAGFALPILFDAGVADDADLRCPGSDAPPPIARSADQLRALSHDEFRACAPQLLGSYAYSLGYRDRDHIAGFTRDSDLPILADRPPDDPAGLGREKNSPNHGTGQNVLFPDGRVQFISTRIVSDADNDVYLNWKGKQEAGMGPRDAVLAPAATPVK